MRKKVNIITLIITLLIISGWYTNYVSLYFLLPLILLYLIINIVGSVNIRLGYFISSHCNLTTSKKEISITFDDGPYPEITSGLLMLLKQHNVKATFFCTGSNMEAHQEIVKNIIGDGHIIGNHSYGHSKLFDLFSSRHMIKEISKTNRVINTISGRTPLLFRPPYGVTNPMLRKALISSKMISVGWSLRSFDTVKSPAKVLSKLISRTNPGDIVLFHDTNPNIITIVEEYISWLNKNDFKIVSLKSLLNISAYED